MHPLIGHGSGIDELLVLFLPVAVFGVLLLLGRRKGDGDTLPDNSPEGDTDARED
jgi:hypothetical protein